MTGHNVNKFLALVEGRGFIGNFGNGMQLTGFLANRIVIAESANRINSEALFKQVESELRSQAMQATQHSKMWISRVSALSPSDSGSYEGFSFYPQEGRLRRFIRLVLGRRLQR